VFLGYENKIAVVLLSFRQDELHKLTRFPPLNTSGDTAIFAGQFLRIVCTMH